jgi:hypothetical protein
LTNSRTAARSASPGRQHDDERWPCGAYPTHSTHDDGITRWISNGEPLENTDVVLPYVFGIHHITRVEDWPIMPVDIVSFWLKPFGFFDQNPSIGVAPSTKNGDHCHNRRRRERARPAPRSRGPADPALGFRPRRVPVSHAQALGMSSMIGAGQRASRGRCATSAGAGAGAVETIGPWPCAAP